MTVFRSRPAAAALPFRTPELRNHLEKRLCRPGREGELVVSVAREYLQSWRRALQCRQGERLSMRAVPVRPGGCRTRSSRQAPVLSVAFRSFHSMSCHSLESAPHALAGGGSGAKFARGGTPVVSELRLFAT